MDWETPADGWYVWLGVSIISLAMAGFVLGLPTGPPPDADQAANTIERTSGSTYQAASTVEHDADEIKVDGKTIELRNEHGTDRSSIRYGEVVAVNGEDRLEDLVYGEEFESVYEDELENEGDNAATVFMNDVARAEENNSGEWLTASEELTVRQVAVEPDEMPEIRVSGTSHGEGSRSRYGWDGIRDDAIPAELSIWYRNAEEIDEIEYTVEGELPSHIRDRIAWSYPSLGYKARWTSTPEESDINLDRRIIHALYLDENYRNSFYIDYNDHRSYHSDGFDHSYIENIDHRHVDHIVEDHETDGDYEEGVWMANYPLRVTATFDDRRCETTLSYGNDYELLCPLVTGTEERADELNWIELNDETGEYHVTLVVV